MHKNIVALCTVILGVVAIPIVTNAAVRINEIAWMGTKVSSNAEWIELVNTGSSKVDLSGWTLIAADGSPHIVIPKDKDISTHGYFLLERTRDSTVPNVPADFIYKGSLSNSGETLVLANASSTIIDKVIGGKKWCLIGGNNKTKQTAQRTETGWITATGTPRTANALVGTTPTCGQTQSTASTIATTTQTKSTTSTATSATVSTETASRGGTNGPPSYEPVPVVFLSIGSNRTVVAGADTKFTALVSDGKGHQYKDASVHWAFGDGSAAASSSVFKSYKAPGTYLVTATAVEGLGSGEDSAIVTVHDALVRVIAISNTGITIANDSDRRLDLSFWRLAVSTTTYVLPEGTKMLPHSTVLFPRGITALPYANNTDLLYPDGKKAAIYKMATHGALEKITTKKSRNRIAERNTLSVQPLVHATGSQFIQDGAHVFISTNARTYDKTEMTAPTTTAHPVVVGALYNATTTIVSKDSSKLEARLPQNLSFTKDNQPLTSPLALSLFGILTVAGIVLVVL